MRHLQVEAVHPRQGGAVRLGIFAFVGAQVFVLLHETPEGVSLLLSGETVLIDKLQLVLCARDVHEVEGGFITVHVVTVAVVVHAGGVGGIIESDGGAKVAAIVLTIRQGGDELVRGEILRVMQLGVVRAVHGVEALPRGVSLISWQAGQLLGPLVGVGEHDVQVFDRLGCHHRIEGGAVALGGVVEDDGATSHVFVHLVITCGRVGVIQAVVGAGEATYVAIVYDVPVTHHDGLDVFVIHPFYGQGEGEGYGQCVVHCERILPNLRHLEIFGNAYDRSAQSGGGWIAVDWCRGGVEEFDHLIYIGQHVVFEFL